MTTLHVAPQPQPQPQPQLQPQPQPHPGNWGPRLLRWTPRILGILFIAFVSMFSLDVFGAGYSPWETLVAFTMHNIPSFVLIACVILAWRWPWVGSLGFLAWTVQYVLVFRGFDWMTYILLAGIPTAIALLYAADWLVRRRVRG